MMYDSIGRREHEWVGLIAAEVREVGAKPGSILVIPVGSIEQYGEHLPVMTDSLLVEAMVNSVAEQTDGLPVVVSPTVWSGFSPHHLTFGGTPSLNFETIHATLEDIAHTGLQNDFDTVLFVNGHGGNGPLIGSVVSTVGVETDAEVLGTTYFELAADRIEMLRDTETGGMAHGGEFETSLMLTVRPDPVGDSSTRNGEPLDESYRWSGRDLLDGGSVSAYRSFDTYSETGAIGFPEEASAEKGERARSITAEELVSLLDAVHEQNA